MLLGRSNGASPGCSFLEKWRHIRLFFFVHPFNLSLRILTLLTLASGKSTVGLNEILNWVPDQWEQFAQLLCKEAGKRKVFVTWRHRLWRHRPSANNFHYCARQYNDHLGFDTFDRRRANHPKCWIWYLKWNIWSKCLTLIKPTGELLSRFNWIWTNPTLSPPGGGHFVWSKQVFKT